MNNIYKDAIADTFIKLCGAHSAKEVTVTEIIKTCGISRQTFYNHFKDKYDIIEYVFDRIASQATAAVYRGEGYLENAIKEMLYVFQNNREYYSTVARLEGQNSFFDFFSGYTNTFYCSVLESLLGKEAVTDDIRYMIRYNAYGIGHMVVDYMLSGMKEDPEVIAPLMVRCLPPELKELFVTAHCLNQQST